MDRFVQTLVEVVEANQRFLLRRSAVQLVLLIIAGLGVWQLAGALWWLSLFLFVLFLLAAILGSVQLATQLTLKLEPPWRAIGLKPQRSPKEQVLELHLMNGGVTLIAVRADMVAQVMSAAGEAGVEVITDTEALKALDSTSKRLERLHDIEALLPHVPSPELRAEIAATISRMRELEAPGADEVLREIEVLLIAEKDAQTTTSLRGPKPVFEKELREKLARLSGL